MIEKKKIMNITLKQIGYAAASAGMVVILTGCSLFGGKKSVKPENAVLPHDRENIAKKSEQKLYTSEEIRKGVVKGDWAIETVYGKDAVGEKAPYLKFVPEEHRVYGNNGCNVLNATYTYNPKDSTISFGEMATTMMLCSKEGLTDYEINTALGAVKYYTWRIDNSDYYLYFYNEAHREVMRLMHQNFDFLNGTWQVTRIEDQAVNVPDMKFVIDVDEGKLHGNTGCNILNGRLDIDMEQPNSISFSEIITTRMACPDLNYETALVVALEEITAAKPVSSNEVIFFDSMNKEVLRMKRVNP